MWTRNNFPKAMNNLPEEVRNKALVIANSRLETAAEPNHSGIILTSIRLAQAAIENKKTKRRTVVEWKAESVAKENSKVAHSKKA